MFIWSTMLNPKTGSLEIKCDRCAGDDDTPQLQPEWEHQGAGAAYDGGGGGVCEAADHLAHLQQTGCVQPSTLSYGRDHCQVRPRGQAVDAVYRGHIHTVPGGLGGHPVQQLLATPCVQGVH